MCPRKNLQGLETKREKCLSCRPTTAASRKAYSKSAFPSSSCVRRNGAFCTSLKSPAYRGWLSRCGRHIVSTLAMWEIQGLRIVLVSLLGKLFIMLLHERMEMSSSVDISLLQDLLVDYSHVINMILPPSHDMSLPRPPPRCWQVDHGTISTV